LHKENKTAWVPHPDLDHHAAQRVADGAPDPKARNRAGHCRRCKLCVWGMDTLTSEIIHLVVELFPCVCPEPVLVKMIVFHQLKGGAFCRFELFLLTFEPPATVAA
jgi:hypothetical protein